MQLDIFHCSDKSLNYNLFKDSLNIALTIPSLAKRNPWIEDWRFNQIIHRTKKFWDMKLNLNCTGPFAWKKWLHLKGVWHHCFFLEKSSMPDEGQPSPNDPFETQMFSIFIVAVRVSLRYRQWEREMQIGAHSSLMIIEPAPMSFK